MITIGETTLEAGAPDVERLLASTGATVAAMRDFLRFSTPAHIVARALNACLEDARDAHELALMIAAEGVDEIRGAVLKIYETAANPDEADQEEPDGEETSG